MENDNYKKLDFDLLLNSISNYTKTENGKHRILASNLHNTRTDAEYQQNLTDEAKNYIIKNNDLDLIYFEKLDNVFQKLKIENIILSLSEIIQIFCLLKNNYYLFRNKKKFESFSSLSTMITNLPIESSLLNMLNNTFNDNYEIKDDASYELKKIRSEIKSKKDILAKLVNKLLEKYNKLGILQENYFTLRDERIVVPIKTEYKKQVKGFIHSESASGSTTFIEPEEVLGLNNDIISLSFQEKREIEKILLIITKQIYLDFDNINLCYDIISILDEIFARAKYSNSINGNIIRFSNNELNLINCRHPVLINKIGYDKTIPFSLKITENIRCLVVSGPNAGGKTVFMKTLGVCALLSKLGVHPPVDPDSSLPFYEDIFIDIGDNQSIENDISTFSSHIKNVNTIYKSVKENSLVLLDELGSGTDPNYGAALASGIIRAFVEKNCFIVITTHQSDLKIFASNYRPALNCSMEFNLNELQPSYKLIPGVPGNSYAFEIAERQNLDKNILNYANEYRNNFDKKADTYLNHLINLINKNKRISSSNQKLKRDLEDKHSLIEEELKKIKEEKIKLKKKDLSETISYLDKAKKLVNETLLEIKKSDSNKNLSNKITNDISNFTTNLNEEIIKLKESTEELKIGDKIEDVNGNYLGLIKEIDLKKKTALVVNENVKLKINLKEIFKSDKQAESIKKSNDSYHKKEELSYRYNIIGKRIKDIEIDLIQYLDAMAISNNKYVEIIHGKGSGILREYVSKVLSEHPLVEKYYSAPIEFGGDGITIVEFKD